MSVAASTLPDPDDTVIVVGRPMPAFRRIQVTPLTGAAGAEIAGVDISRPLDDETLTELPQAPIFPGHPDMQEVRREAYEPVSVVPFARFHTDSPFLATPPLCMVMRTLDVPRYGDDTACSNMYLICEALSDGLKATLDMLQVVYSAKDI